MSARILIEGVGSVGGLLAGELLSHGHDLTLVTGNPVITATIKHDGIAVDTPNASSRSRPRPLPHSMNCRAAPVSTAPGC